ncbi:hypothetical protein MMC07_003479 [Pseudocyphellaria aurata]|nr:hypothetical protein [Pseudocyphellaria aurata]
MPLTLKSPSIGKGHAPSTFLCPSCWFRNAINSLRVSVKSRSGFQARWHPPPRRHASTSAPVSPVSAHRELPPPFQELRSTLSALQKQAAAYVNAGQVQLALRGVESENPVTRVVVLGLNGHQGASRLTRVLLADPLSPEPEWEKQLLIEADRGDGKALLLRFGEEADFDPRNPLVKTLTIPSTKLRAHNLEILVQPIPLTSSLMNAGDNDFLVPGLEVPNSTTGRTAMIRYPVHKALVYAEGLQHIASVSRSDTHRAHASSQMVRGVVDAGWTNLQRGAIAEQTLSPINLADAESAIDNFRKSVEMALEYEHAWFGSGLANVSAWLVEGVDVEPYNLKPTLRRLIETISNNAEQGILQEHRARTRQLASSTISPLTRESLNQDLTKWAEIAHTELRMQLEYAFLSRNWTNLAWWKLFWRVDDVSSVTEDILQQAWLVEAEKEMIWTFGRIEQAGLGDPAKLSKHFHDPLDRSTLMVLEEWVRVDYPGVDAFEGMPRPWPYEISRARLVLIRRTIPSLQADSQRFLFQAISTTFLTSSLATLLYISTSTVSMYEAGALAAVGFAYSMRRLQKQWNLRKNAWAATVREAGRQALREVEHTMRALVRDGGKGVQTVGDSKVDEREEEDRISAQEGVERVRQALATFG